MTTVLRTLGNFYSRTKQMDQLEKLNSDLLARKPDSMTARKMLAEMSLRKGEWTQAKRYTVLLNSRLCSQA